MTSVSRPSAALIIAGAMAGVWHPAIEVPGTAALNKGGAAQVTSVSCASPGNCAAGGYYRDGKSFNQAFVASEVSGTWHNAIQVPGTAALNIGGDAATVSLSCTSAGTCAASGTYTDNAGNRQVFVVNQVSGTWHNAIQVPGMTNLNTSLAGTYSLSCTSSGDCSDGGFFTLNGQQEAFVVNEVNGTWHDAIQVPGTAALNTVGDAATVSLSCASPGNCGAGGYYRDTSGIQAFVVSEVNGTWHKAIEVPGSGPLDKGGDAQVSSVSCGSAGSCTAGGEYMNDSVHTQIFIANETGGTWHTATEVPGTATLNRGGAAWFGSVSCSARGSCSAGGSYVDGAGNAQAFVATETGGIWHSATEVPGTAALNRGGSAQVTSVSCASPGNCDAGGDYLDSAARSQAFVVAEVHGTWQRAAPLPGAASLNTGGIAQVSSISCVSASSCGAGGFYTDYTGSLYHSQAFVASES